MSSDDDSYSPNKSHSFGRIVELLKLRNQPSRRRLYNYDPPVDRRSLNVQKKLQKPVAKLIENSVFEEPINDAAMRDEHEIQYTPVASPARIITRAKKKSMVCSTPITVDVRRDFLSSLSPVRTLSVRPISELINPDFLDQNAQNKNISSMTAPKSQAKHNMESKQPRIVLLDVLNCGEKKNIRLSSVRTEVDVQPEPAATQVSNIQKDSIEPGVTPQPQINLSNPIKLLTPVSSNSVSESSLSESIISSDRASSSRTITKSNANNRETLKESLPGRNSSCSANSESTRGNSSALPKNSIRPELSLKLRRDARELTKTSHLDTGSNTLDGTKQNSELLNANRKRTKSLKNVTSKIISPSSNRAANSPEIDRLLIIPETQDDNDKIGDATSMPATQEPSRPIEILNVEIIQNAFQRNSDVPSMTSVSTSSSIANRSNTYIKASRAKRQKKTNNTYLQFLALEKSTKRKSSAIGAKRKLYSSEQERLTEPKNSESHSPPKRNQSLKKNTPTPTIVKSPPAIDAEGFKIPNQAHLATKSSRKTTDESTTSEYGAIAENIRILNSTRPAIISDNILELDGIITKDVSTSKPPGKRKGPKPKSKQPIIHENTANAVADDTVGVRRSTRVKNQPVTFWKVQKEPIIEYQAKFYKKMMDLPDNYQSKKAKKQRNKPKSPKIADIAEPIVAECIEPEQNVRENGTMTPPMVEIPMENIVQAPQIVEKLSNEPVSTLAPGNAKGLHTSDSNEPVSTLAPGNAKGLHTSDSGLQITSEPDNNMNPHTKFLKKFNADCSSAQQNQQVSSQLLGGMDYHNIDKLVFKKYADTPGLEFSFVPNTNDMLGFLKLQPGTKKSESRTSRKYFLTLMLFTNTPVTIKINQNIIEMALGEIDMIQLFPDSRYEIINNGPTTVILMTVRTKVLNNNTNVGN